MKKFREAVYIFENPKAVRVKVGMTMGGTVTVTDRLRDLNDKWLQVKGVCQICGCWRLLDKKRHLPQHVVSGKTCKGSNTLPMEKDTVIAEAYLKSLIKDMSQLTGSAKPAMGNSIANLRKRVELYQAYQPPIGLWKLNTTYWVDHATGVEKHAHEVLANYLDQTMPIGEIFNCGVDTASQAIEEVLYNDQYDKEVVDTTTSYDNGECSICGGPRTVNQSCPSCMERFGI